MVFDTCKGYVDQETDVQQVRRMMDASAGAEGGFPIVGGVHFPSTAEVHNRVALQGDMIDEMLDGVLEEEGEEA